jgi:hypothetical protein
MPSIFRGDDDFDTAGGNAVKAWVNFNGTGTVAIRASYNVSSITDNGIGEYTVNFTNALSDANYALSGMTTTESGNIGIVTSRLGQNTFNKSTTSFSIGVFNTVSPANTDKVDINVAVFR